MWSEEMPVIYEMVQFVQTEFLDNYFREFPVEESKGMDPSLEGKVIMAYKSSQKCQEVFRRV